MASRRQRKNSVQMLQKAMDKVRRESTCSTGPCKSPAVYSPCDILTVHVIRGRKITHGYFDYVDTPDPYLLLRIPTAVTESAETRHIDNCKDPEWDETFSFHIDFDQENILDITLMDANPLGLDETVGSVQFDIKELKFDERVEKTFTVYNGCELYLAFTLAKDDAPPDMRFSLDLCSQEKSFLKTRKDVVFRNMQTMFGTDGPRTKEEVPSVAIIGSGGGFRAMVGLAGVMKALTENKIIDVTNYMSALSGSSWYLSILYSEPNFPETLSAADAAWLHELKEKIDQSMMWLLEPTHLLKYAGYLREKAGRGQPVTFTDIFGLMVGETLIANRMDACLSDQRRAVDSGSVPMPLYESIYVKRDVSASIFGEHIEMNPYEIGMETYGVYMDTPLFGSAFVGGRLVKKFPEAKLHYLQGILGSAYTILFNRLVDPDPNSKNAMVESKIREEMHKTLKEQHDHAACHPHPDDDHESWTDFISNSFNSSNVMTSRKNRAAVIYSFLKDIKFAANAAISLLATDVQKLNTICLADAGLTFNSPFPMVLRENRSVDLILSFDFSGRESHDEPPFAELLLAEMWAKEHGKPFPPIDLTAYEKHGIQEMYVFEDPDDLDCPLVLHFPLVNKAFRKYKSPGVPRETEEEREYANFDIFADNSPYSTFNFNYPHEAFDKMVNLMEFNTLYKMADIKEAILRRINLKKGINKPMAPTVYDVGDAE